MTAAVHEQLDAWKAEDRSRPLRQALGDVFVLSLRERDAFAGRPEELPSSGECALAWAGLAVAWARLTPPLALAVYHDEVATVERQVSCCFFCARPGPTHRDTPDGCPPLRRRAAGPSPDDHPLPKGASP